MINRLPPQNLGLEEAVLGAAMIDNTAPRVILNLIAHAEVFYKPLHQTIFKAVQSLFNKGEAIDILTIVNQIRSTTDIKAQEISLSVVEISNKVNSAANINKHCAILLEIYTRRQLIISANTLAEKAYALDEDIFDLLFENQQNLNHLNDTLSIKEPQTLDKLYYEALEEISQATQNNGLTGVPSGIHSIDKLTGGWQPSDLIILAARPSMGKTSLAVQIARNAAIDFKKPTAIFSLEMSSLQLTKKLIATESNNTTSQLSKGQIQGGFDGVKIIANNSQKLITRNLIIDDEAGLTSQSLRAKAAKLKADFDIQLIIIDYLQLMTGEGKGNREQEISSISRSLKKLAKELNIPIIALSQLSRSVESRGDKTPMLSDLRESGAIEQDADLVIFLLRPEYYGITEDEMGNSTLNTAQVIFAKHRNGAVGTIYTGCDIQYGRFFDLKEKTWTTTATTFPTSDFEQTNTPF